MRNSSHARGTHEGFCLRLDRTKAVGLFIHSDILPGLVYVVSQEQPFPWLRKMAAAIVKRKQMCALHFG